MAINNIYDDGIKNGWDVRDASSFTAATTIEADVIIVGSGAGGGTAAEILANQGLKVLLVEEGPLKTSSDFKDMRESRGYTQLYQEGAGRTTSDGAITVLQGRSVGGTTTVNWTSSFRTPEGTLQHWASEYGVKEWSVEAAKPWFDNRTERLGIAPWAMPPNANNAVLKTGCEKLGWEWHIIPRNVKGCWNSGYCGYGCPVNAKQSMLVSTIPGALAKNATLVHHLRVNKLIFSGSKVSSVEAIAMDAACLQPSGVKVTLKAPQIILAGGAINSPALLLRSKAADPYGRIGQRTMIHPVVFTYAQMPGVIDGYYGAPQSTASDHFQWQGDFSTAPGFKMEVPPIAPGLIMAFSSHTGEKLMQDAASLPKLNAMLALIRDGFHEQSVGGQVKIDDAGNPILDYDVTGYLFKGFKNALLRMSEMQFAAGAEKVMPAHLDAEWTTSWAESKAQIEALAMKKFRLAIGTAHIMGGCGMGEDVKRSVVDSYGQHHQIENLHIMDGSVFPTSIGANPQLSIYGLVTRNATKLAEQLKPVKA